MKIKDLLDDHFVFEDEKKFRLKDWHRTAIFFLVIAAVLNLLAVIYVTGGKAIFFWDDATYWDISRRILSGGMNEGGFWHNIYNSVAAEDYNYIAALPSAAVMSVFGESRLAYVLGLVNMYLLPVCVMIYLLAKKISKAPKISAVITLLLLPCTLFLTYIGFVDMGALLMCLVCYNLYYPKKDGKDSFWHYPVIGALLVFMILWRRYFAFFAVSFITAMIVDCVLYKRKWYCAAATVLTAAAIMLLFFRDFVLSRLMADYGNMYAGYKFSVMTDFKLITRYFGLIFTAVLAVCSAVMYVKKKETRVVFMWIQAIVCLTMFMATQTHGQQHLLLYIPSLVMLTLIAIRHITKEWMLVGISALALLHTVFVYTPRPQPTNIQEIKSLSLIPTFSMIPSKRTDTEEILALKQRLDEVVYEGDTLGVLSSSFKLNEDILKNVEPSLGVRQTRPDYIVSLPQVDSRDKDLTALYNVNYILAAFPSQTHLAEGSQTVVTEAVKSFEQYTDIATAYEEIYECAAEIDGITVKLFHRVRDEERKDIAEFEARLYRR